MKKRSKYRAKPVRQYSLVETLMADRNAPMALSKREAQLDQIRAGIEGMRTAEAPGRMHWDPIADCVNLLETLVEHGYLNDDGGWIREASTELAMAAKRSREGKGLRMTGPGLTAVENALEGYESALSQLPERRMIDIHRLTEIRIHEIHSGKRRAHDIEVVSL